MNKTNFKKLIRETIYKLLEQDSKFSEGDVVKTNHGEEGVIVLAKHPYYSVTLDDTGVTKSYHHDELRKTEEFYGKYDTSEAPDLEESSSDNIIVLDGTLKVQDSVNLSDVLSDIRSILGVTVVRTEDIPGSRTNTNLHIKIDPYPFKDRSDEEIKDFIKTSIRRIPGTKEFWSQGQKPIQELKFRIKEIKVNQPDSKLYKIVSSGQGNFKIWSIIKQDGSELLNMEFDSPEEAQKYADKKGIKTVK